MRIDKEFEEAKTGFARLGHEIKSKTWIKVVLVLILIIGIYSFFE